MVKGFGRECATQMGLIGRTVDVEHAGPTCSMSSTT
jgi:hypothetical protein